MHACEKKRIVPAVGRRENCGNVSGENRADGRPACRIIRFVPAGRAVHAAGGGSDLGLRLYCDKKRSARCVSPAAYRRGLFLCRCRGTSGDRPAQEKSSAQKRAEEFRLFGRSAFLFPDDTGDWLQVHNGGKKCFYNHGIRCDCPGPWVGLVSLSAAYKKHSAGFDDASRHWHYCAE